MIRTNRSHKTKSNPFIYIRILDGGNAPLSVLQTFAFHPLLPTLHFLSLTSHLSISTPQQNQHFSFTFSQTPLQNKLKLKPSEIRTMPPFPRARIPNSQRQRRSTARGPLPPPPHNEHLLSPLVHLWNQFRGLNILELYGQEQELAIQVSRTFVQTVLMTPAMNDEEVGSRRALLAEIVRVTEEAAQRLRDAAAPVKTPGDLSVLEDVSDFKDGEDCSICLEPLGAAATTAENATTTITARLTTCGHCFHRGCIEEWLGSRNKCPLCRARVERAE